jgi:hypothetical protein
MSPRSPAAALAAMCKAVMKKLYFLITLPVVAKPSPFTFT